MNKENRVQNIINQLKALEVDGETMQHIITEVGMEQQMLKQLVMTSSKHDMDNVLSERDEMLRHGVYKFARKCDIRGEGMNAGYCIGDGDMYIKYEGDMLNHLYKQEGYDRSWTDDETLEYFFDQGYYYYTDWEADEDEWYEADNEDGINPKLVEAEF